MLNSAKITVPSWTIPGTYIENLYFLAEKSQIDGVELLFFSYDDDTKTLFERELDEIKQFSSRFTFTAHLPDALTAGHKALVSKLTPFVRHFIVHPAPPSQIEAQAAFLQEWMAEWGADRFLIENTKDGYTERLLPRLPDETKLCMDTGHLLLCGSSPAEYAKLNAARIKEIHLHGLKDNFADHGVIHNTDRWFRELYPFLRDFSGIINIEIFSWEEIAAALDILLKMPI